MIDIQLQITAKGGDDFGPFTVLVPDQCLSCDSATDMVVKYNATRQTWPSLLSELRRRGIDPDTPSLIIKRPWKIGVTCGCYARFHRQVASIQRKQSNSRRQKKYPK